MAKERGDSAPVAWINGRLQSSLTPALTVTDRGFQLGDGVFETLRVSEGRALELPLHLSRLRASAQMLSIMLPNDLETSLEAAIAEVCEANSLGQGSEAAAVRVTVSRGGLESRALLPPNDTTANVVVQAWPVPTPPAHVLAQGLSLVIAKVRRDPDSPLASVKTTSRADFVFARLEADRKGADDALFLTTAGHLAEATTASLFIVEQEGLATPSLACGILVSTTRAWIVSSGARELGLEVRQACLHPDELFAAREAFLASSVAGILPVTTVEGRPIGFGRPGKLTMRLRELREHVAASPPR